MSDVKDKSEIQVENNKLWQRVRDYLVRGDRQNDQDMQEVIASPQHENKFVKTSTLAQYFPEPEKDVATKWAEMEEIGEIGVALEEYRPQERIGSNLDSSEARPLVQLDSVDNYTWELLPKTRFHIINRLGRGGMSNIYIIYDSLLRRRVAGKWATHTDEEKFNALATHLEGQVASQLGENPVTVEPFDVRVFKNKKTNKKQDMLLMPIIEGPTLTTLMNDEALIDEDRIAIVTQLGDYLDFLATKGVSHGDLKPSNIIIDRNGRVRVIDWGASEQVISFDEPKPGTVRGTPEYLSPEKIKGESSDPVTSDRYNLGLIAFAVHANENYYQIQEDDIEFRKLLTRIATDSDNYFNERSKEVELNASEERFYRKALDPDPKNRFSSGKELAEAFAEMLRTNPTQKSKEVERELARAGD